MTKRDYVRIAHVLAKHNASDELIESMAEMMKQENPKFKKSTFRTFVKLESWHHKIKTGQTEPEMVAYRAQYLKNTGVAT